MRFLLLRSCLLLLCALPMRVGAMQPVLSDLQKVTWAEGHWYAVIGTTLYQSENGREWEERASLPDRASGIVPCPAQLAIAGRDYLFFVGYSAKTPEKPIALAGDWVGVWADDDHWVALDARGRVMDSKAQETPVQLGDGLRMTNLVKGPAGDWWAYGACRGQGALFHTASTQGPWARATLPSASPLLHLVATTHGTLAFTAGGSVFRLRNDGEWAECALFNHLGGEAAIDAVGSETEGFVALLKDGTVRSWDGEAWSRVTYHEDEYQARSLVNGPRGVSILRLSPDDPEAGIRSTPIASIPIPVVRAIDVGDPSLGSSFKEALSSWDTALAASHDPVVRAKATATYLKAIQPVLQALPPAERASWLKRVASRLGVQDNAVDWMARLETGQPFANGSASETEEDGIHPPLFDVDQMRRRAVGGHAGSRLDLAVAYLHGAGVRADPLAAKFWLDWANEADPSFPTIEQLEVRGATLEQLRILAEQGSSWADVLLADHYREGSLIEMDFEEAAKWYRRAAELGNYDGATTLGEFYLLGWGVDRDPAVALTLFAECARAHHPLALYNFGRCFEMGAGIARDPERAAYYYQQAAEMGEPRSLRKLADYAFRTGDKDQTEKLLMAAAESGDREAERRLEALKKGEYVPPATEPYARSTLRAAAFNLEARVAEARANHAGACYDVSWAARNGYGMYPNTRYALWWLERARKLGASVPTDEHDIAAMRELAKQGSLVAMVELAETFLATDSPANLAEGKAWISAAAEKGHFGAQGRLGSLLREGIGGPANPIEGMLWWERAADAGDPLANYHLGVALSTGDGAKLDPVRALEFFRKAATGGVRRAQVDLAYLIASGQAKGVNRNEASAWYQALAGLDPVTCPPEAAARRIELRARQGSGEAEAVLAVLYRLGFGVEASPIEATAWSLLAEEHETNLYALSWYSENGDAEAARRRAQELRGELPALTATAG